MKSLLEPYTSADFFPARWPLATATSVIIQQSPLLSRVQRRIEEVIDKAGGELQKAAAHLFGGKGKLLRPTLVLLTAQAIFEANGEPPLENADARASSTPGVLNALYDFAAAVELVHVASLMHDDVIDMAPTRRSRPSVNAAFGNHTAVLAGDYLFASAFGLLSRHATQGAVTLMTEAIAQMCRGELLQKESLFDPRTTAEAYFTRVQAKTASLIAAACEGGARLAGAGEELCRAFRAFGESLGVAFQIADDILDLEQSSKELGKPVCSDLRQGVVTLPVIRLLQDPEWYERLARPIQARAVTEDVIRLVVDGVQTTGALAWARQSGHSRAQAAADLLGPFSSTRAGTALAALCGEVMTRRR